MRFEYKTLRNPSDDQLNELAAAGWMIQQFIVSGFNGALHFLLARSVAQ